MQTHESKEQSMADQQPVVELGLDTFGDRTVDLGGNAVPYPQVIRDVVEEAVLADKVGVDFFGIGEHHREDFAISAPEIVLAAIASRTERIHVGTAVTVLSSDDPVRVFEKFATLDAVSKGRAEIILGRGSFTESFPLFGFNLQDYEGLFEEKVGLLHELLKEQPVTWQGALRPPLTDADVFPKTENGIRTWVGVGGSPESVVRAARYGFPLVLAIIGGEPARFAPLFDLYREAAKRAGSDPAGLATSINVHGFIADTTEQAADDFYGPQAEVMNRIGRERGWGPTSRAHFDQARGPNGALFVGNPEQVAEKIVAQHKIFNNDRFLLQMAIGTMPHAKIMKAIELYGTRVAPIVRKETAKSTPAVAAPVA
jgi:probable LLM family oxidoreductase